MHLLTWFVIFTQVISSVVYADIKVLNKVSTLATPSIFQESSPSEKSEEFRKSVLSDIKFRTVAFSIASHFLIKGKNRQTLIRNIRDKFRNNQDFLKEIDLENVYREKDVVYIPFTKDGKKYEMRICSKEVFESLDRSKSDWAVSERFGIQVMEPRSGDKLPNMKGMFAPPSNPVIQNLIKQGQMVELVFEEGMFKAYYIKYIEGYIAGSLQPDELGEYRGQPYEIKELLNDEQRTILNEWITTHHIRGAPIKFRIALNTPALGWHNDIEHSNVAHAGSHDNVIYIGDALLRHILIRENRVLRKEILDDDEYRHLIDPTFNHHADKEEYKRYQERLKKVEVAIKSFGGTIGSNVIVEESSEFAATSARQVGDEIRRLQKEQPDHDVTMVFATGNTMVEFLDKLAQEKDIDWSRFQAFHLDEYKGLDKEHKSSSAYFLKTNFFDKVKIPEGCIHYISEYVKRYDRKGLAKYMEELQSHGGADIVILGIGPDGHLAFNEPPKYSSFDLRIQEVNLTESTIEANEKDYPDIRKNPHVYTMGMADIFDGRKLFFLANGSHKTEIVRKAMLGPVTEEVPASMLQLHKNVVWILDVGAASALGPLGRQAALAWQTGTIGEIIRNMGYLWDARFKYLHEQAKAMSNGTIPTGKEAIRKLREEYRQYLAGGEEQKKAQQQLGLREDEIVVYDSMEYALTHELPFFAGGLGALAGDHVRSASDILPSNTLVCIGPYYRLGYLLQRIRATDSWQEERYNRVEIERFAEIAKDEDGKDIVIALPMPNNATIYAKAWKVQAGRTIGYFLTTDIDENNVNREYRYYLDRTYESSADVRLVQEYVVSVGGEQLLARLGLTSRMIHLNEGHVAFAILEKARQLILKKIEYLNKVKGLKFDIHNLHNIPIETRQKYGLTIQQALAAVRQMVGFTSHTPVTAGNQKFNIDVTARYLTPYLETFGASFNDLNFSPLISDGNFDMTEFVLTYCNFFNGVSRKHAEVCGEMYGKTNKMIKEKLGYIRPEATSITNAVNRAFYQPPQIQALLIRKLEALRKDNTFGPAVTLDNLSADQSAALLKTVTDEELEETSKAMMQDGIETLKRIRPTDEKADARTLPLTDGQGVQIDPNAFIVAFGRRMAGYKRPTFILDQMRERDIETWRAVVREARKTGKNAQIIFMGKAHRDDNPGKELIQRILHIAKYDPELKDTILFIEDYNTEVAKVIMQIATVVLNNPNPPEEASGTSGMKFLLAGKPSITVMDGWVLEAKQGVYPFVTKEELKDTLVGEWRFKNHVGTEEKGVLAYGHILSQEREIIDGKVIYECFDPSCRHVWTVDADAVAPAVCEHCKRPAIKDSSYHELGLMDAYFNHRDRWCQIMRESIAQGLSYFTSHRMFKEYTEKMYVPTITASREAEQKFMAIGMNSMQAEQPPLEPSKGSSKAALKAIYYSELKDKTDISIREDLLPKREKAKDLTYALRTVQEEVQMLKALGILVEGTRPHTYQLRSEIRNLSPPDLDKILAIPELDRSRIPKDKMSSVKANVDMMLINNIDVGIMPAVEKGKTLWHVIPLTLIPQSQYYNQRAKFIKFVKQMNKDYPDMREKIRVVTNRQDLAKVVSELANDPNNIVDVALDNEDYIDKLPDGIPMLVFKPKDGDLGDFRQLEGILASLRALHIKDYSQRKEKLSRLHELLTGEAPKEIPDIPDPKEFAKHLIFILPPIRIENSEDLKRLNENLLKLIESA